MSSLYQGLQESQANLLHRFQKIIQANKLSHAYLFAGGKETFDMALYLTQSIYCEKRIDGLPCGHCRSCKLVAAQAFPDLHVVSPANRVIRTDQIKSLLEQASQSGLESTHQVFIFQDADMMHVNGANALLKSMEEPTGQQHFFFLTKASEKILPTIQSRSQYVYFPDLGQVLVAEFESQGLLKTQAQFLNTLLQGNVRMLDTVGQGWMLEMEVQLAAWLQLFLKGNVKAFPALAALVAQADDRDKQSLFLDILEIQLGQKVEVGKRWILLKDLMEARTTWQANVPLLMSLERFLLKNL
ncbi:MULTISPECIES: DNA polymerase III subunit delta' [unclassified Streptococcus]|uniref:DNA polymerase III subunit delta' n=1 Tax=unclassified Streptococcus TaxID=2608887 RepID=UPI001071D02C|nr:MULTISPECIES: DNA polymerase III subunit delta' [unclassified Streptococcus]MBF0806011.1 DNA polymerase III subunit delta' [Streptococcus sp. 19428wA2_WM07]TFU28415.1 DNA polymerase III subunit delta' [Streptococcus sp. WM07]